MVLPILADTQEINLSWMAVACDMISQLGLRVYNEGMYKPKPDSEQTVAWVRYDLPSRKFLLSLLSLEKYMEGLHGRRYMHGKAWVKR